MRTVAIVGAGHNGLVCATYLGRAGLDVTVFEADDTAGGCVWTETTTDGYRFERGAIDHTMILDVADDLGLAEHGLDYIFRDVAVGAGFGDGERLLFHTDLEGTLEGLALSPRDAAGYRRMAKTADALFGLVGSFDAAPGLVEVAKLGEYLEDDPVALLLTSAEKVVHRHVADPHLAAALTMYGAHGQLPPWLPGTGLFGLLLPGSHGRAPGRPRGGSQRLIDALVAAVEATGGSVRTSTPITSIGSGSDGATLTTASGERRDFDCVVSSVDVVRTTALLEDPPASLVESATHSTSGSLNISELKLDLALSAPVGPAEGEGGEAIWMLQPDIRSLARSFGEIVAGDMPSEPSMMWASPSVLDPSAAPPGGGTAWLSAFVPARRREGSWDAEADKMAVEWLLDGFHAITGRDLRPHILDSRVTGPSGWERRTGAPAGNPNHIDQTIDQMFGWRPPAGSGYRTEVPWLFLSGAGTYPGGGLSGLPGRNAAMAVLGGGSKRRGRFGADVAAMRRGWKLFRTLRRRT